MRLALMLFTVLLAACSEAPEPPPPRDPELPPVVVYSAYKDTDYLPALFSDFTKDTGIPVVVRHRSDEENLADMQAKSGSQPADILLTRSAWTIWKAADEGLLRPLPPVQNAQAVGDNLKDPDGQWIALSARRLVIHHAPDIEPPAALVNLADERYRGKLCLVTSKQPSHRLMLAHLLADIGRRDAEMLVRLWVANLAIPPLEDDQSLVRAIAEGRCGLGIVSREAIASQADVDVVADASPPFDIEGLGIGRHARSPEDAATLIDWLLSEDVQQRHARAVRYLPAGGADTSERLKLRDISSAGFLYPDAIQMAERARYY